MQLGAGTGTAQTGSESEKEFSEIVKKQPEKYNVEASAPRRGQAWARRSTPSSWTTRSPTPASYDRLYFDKNHNGDLTDDKPIDAEGGDAIGHRYRAVDVSPRRRHGRVGRHALDYAFLLSSLRLIALRRRTSSTCPPRSMPAAYREGEVTLDGKKHHVVLLDFNSNGRFDDEATHRRRCHDGRRPSSIPRSATCCWSIPRASRMGYAFYRPTAAAMSAVPLEAGQHRWRVLRVSASRRRAIRSR